MGWTWNKVARRAAAVAVLSLLPAGLGCGAFFVCQGKSSCGTSSTTTNTIDAVYVTNSVTGATYLNGYTLASGTLTAIAGSPFALNYEPSAIVVTTSNAYLYAASTSGTIYSYALSSAGVPSNGTAQATTGIDEASMDVSPDGKWLFVLDAAQTTTQTTATLRLYAIQSSGVLAAQTSITFTPPNAATVVAPTQVKVSPTGAYVGIALGTTGAAYFSFNTSTGATGAATVINTGISTATDTAVGWDSSNNFYIGLTDTTTKTNNGVVVYSIANAKLGALAVTGQGPRSIALANSYGYLYTGNFTDSTLSGFSVASGALTSVSTVNFAGPTDVSALATDNTGKYVFAAGYDPSVGMQVFSIGTSGLLTVQTPEEGTAALTSALVPVALAVTH